MDDRAGHRRISERDPQIYLLSAAILSVTISAAEYRRQSLPSRDNDNLSSFEMLGVRGRLVTAVDTERAIQTGWAIE